MFVYLGKREYNDPSENEKSLLQRLDFFNGDLKLGGLYFHQGRLYRVLVKEYYSDVNGYAKPVCVEVCPGFDYKNKEC